MPAPDATKVPDRLQRDFTASEPNIKYVGDITYLPIGGGQFLYLATVLDLCSKWLAGWAIADHMRTELVTDALEAAARTRGGDLVGAVFHSDNRVRLEGLRQGMPQTPRDPFSWGGRDERGQRRGGELQRGPETRDPSGPEALAGSTRGPPRGIPVDHSLQHQVKA